MSRKDDQTRCFVGRDEKDAERTQWLPPEDRAARDPPASRSGDSGAESPRREPKAPEAIGEYRIIRRIGEGGMGFVFEAEQQRPQRKVALKVIRGGRFVDEMQVRMFLREAETLGRLKHPGIAQIYESGTTEEGQHYFAMELVRGQTLSDYLSARCGLSTSKSELRFRLELFRSICLAVGYAHQRGVIHRDLKPGNIMVVDRQSSTSGSLDGSVPEIKILDFGLARIIHTDGRDGVTQTAGGAILGTPRYMSPEQARGATDQIDVRTDIYSLGMILYEILTGCLPYDVDATSLVEVVRIICEKEPVSLSRLNSSNVRISTDLNIIALKAVAKDPDQRYQSAAEFAQDIGRFLDGEAILARPPSTVYQMRKLVLRHRFGFSFAATVVVLLAALSVAQTVQAKRIANERDRANREAARAGFVSDFLIGLFQISDPSQSRGETVTARELLDRGAQKIQRDLEDEPLVRASLMDTMGSVYVGLGLYDKALPLLEKGLELRSAELDPLDLEIGDSMFNLARAYSAQGRNEKATPLFEKTLKIREAGLDPDDPDVVNTLLGQGSHYWREGDYRRAEQLYQRALKLAGNDRELSPILRATALNNLGALHYRRGEIEQARKLYLSALELREREFGDVALPVATTLNNLAEVYRSEGRLEKAEPLYRRSLAIREKLLEPDHPRLAVSLNNLAEVYREEGAYDQALPLYRQALGAMERRLGSSHVNVGTVLYNLADVNLRQGDFAEAERLARRSLATTEAALGNDHVDVAETLALLGKALAKLGRSKSAAEVLRRAIAIWQNAGRSESRACTEAVETLSELLRDSPARDE